ncbi:hypothetical protein [Prescottella agglutinans]|uniref:Uncharacterized protein n=1 Tax=Prescottella agglutinans TaxID=1644129 RepID=A0ABT6MHP8_9NOCA|nr:hypothetical protein [Prescottella agglutinans]MDH6282879.1 hypothetical protein [Prescottella agglutinans]
MTSIDLDKLEQVHAKATPGEWAAYNMADDSFDTEDGEGWWWVWVAGRKDYAGVFRMDNGPSNKAAPDGEIAQARIADHDSGIPERNDAKWIAAIHNAAPALIAELREARATIERVRAMAYSFAVGADGEERILAALDGDR